MIASRQAHSARIVTPDRRQQTEVVRLGDLALLGNPLPELPLRQQSGEKGSAYLIGKRLRLQGQALRKRNRPWLPEP